MSALLEIFCAEVTLRHEYSYDKKKLHKISKTFERKDSIASKFKQKALQIQDIWENQCQTKQHQFLRKLASELFV